PVVEAQLDRAPALGQHRRGVRGAPLWGADLDAGGVGGDAVAEAAPQLVERLAAGLPDDIPEGDLQAPGGVGVAEEARVAPQLERRASRGAILASSTGVPAATRQGACG